MGKKRAPEIEGIKRVGRVGLWVVPPVGLWRSVRHGKERHEDRLAKKIGDELRRQPDAIDKEIERIRGEL